MKINHIDYNYSKYRQNSYNKNSVNSGNVTTFNGCCNGLCTLDSKLNSVLAKIKAKPVEASKPAKHNLFYMEHLTDEELERLSSYAKSLKQKIIPENMMLGPTFDTVDKVAKMVLPYNSLYEFIKLALRAENEVTNNMVLKAKYYSDLCADKYPKENYSKEVDEVLNQIETFESAVLEELSSNPLWNKTDLIHEQKNWMSVNQAIIKECDDREKTINEKMELMDLKFTLQYQMLLQAIKETRCKCQAQIDSIKESVFAISRSIPSPGGCGGYTCSHNN